MTIDDVKAIIRARSESNLAMYVDLRQDAYLAAHKECDNILKLIEEREGKHEC